MKMSITRQGRLHRAYSLATAAALAVAFVPAATAADPVPVYGGPTYSTSAGGYLAERYPLFRPFGYLHSAHVNDAGIAASTVRKYDGSGNEIGVRAVRWSHTGSATELGGGADSMNSLRAERINAGGVVVGSVNVGPESNSQQFRPARWSPSSTDATVLEHPFVYSTSSYSSGSTFVHDLNDAGTAVGAIWVSPLRDNWVVDLGTRAARWDPSGAALTELGHLGTSAEGDTAEGYTQAYARAINAAGAAVGNAQKYDAAGTYLGYRAVRWDPSDVTAIELGRLGTHANAPWAAPDGFTQSQAFAINSAGTVVGYSDVYDDAGNLLRSSAPVRWDASGTPTELGTFGAGGSVVWSPSALNEDGTAVGWAMKVRDDGVLLGNRAVRWDAAGTAATELGNLGTAFGMTQSQAWAVNAAGTAVGYANTYSATGDFLGERAVYWGADAAAVDLNSLIGPDEGWLLMRALEISDTGWIVGTGLFDPDGAGGQDAYSRHFLMQVPATVPEPGTFILLGLALPALLRRRAR